MNALNDVNKVINNVSYYGHGHHEEDEWLTAERMAVIFLILRLSLIDKLLLYYPPGVKSFSTKSMLLKTS